MARYGVLSDVHGNGVALEAVLGHLKTQSVDEIWFLGDLVGYGPVPGECIQKLIVACDWPVLAIQGNNDWAVAQEEAIDTSKLVHDLVAHHGVTMDADRERRIKATGESQNWTIQVLTPEERRILGDDLKATSIPTAAGPLLVHASPCEAVGKEGNYLRVKADAEEAFLCDQFQICFFGHTHQPGVFRRMAVDRPYANVTYISYSPAAGNGTVFELDDRRVLINPGSIGQPRDGDPRAAYAIYDEEKQRVEFHRVVYPVEDTISQLRDIGASREWHSMAEVMIQRLREAE